MFVILAVVGGVGLLSVGAVVVGAVLYLTNGPAVAGTPTSAAGALPPWADPKPAPAAPPQKAEPPRRPQDPIDPPQTDRMPAPLGNRPAMPPTNGQPLVSDLKVPSVKVSSEWPPGARQLRDVLPALTWAADGKAFYALDHGANVVRRFSYPDMNEEAKLPVGKEVTWLSLSKEGLVVTVQGDGQAWVLDPKTLAKGRTFPTGKAWRVVSAPSLSVGYVCDTEERRNFNDLTAQRPHGGVLRVIDLKTGQQVKEYDVLSLDPKGALYETAISTDGKHLFTIGGQNQLQQYALDGERVTFVTTSPNMLQQGTPHQPVVSADGRLVSAPSGGGNMLVKNGQAVINYNTYVFTPGNLNDPLLNLEAGAYPKAMGFDTQAGLIYAQNSDYHLIVYDFKGVKLRSCRLVSFRLNGMGGSGVRQLLPHPDGGKLLILVAHGQNGGEATAFAVEFPKN